MAVTNFENQNASKTQQPSVEASVASESSKEDENTPSQTMVQIPAESLLSLRNEITRLRKENQDLKCLINRSGAAFGRFPLLPVELRSAIWDFALRAPQVHVLCEELLRPSAVNNIMQSCTEARNRGRTRNRPYYQLRRAPDSRQYMNPEVDTILISEEDLNLTWVEFFCGRKECAQTSFDTHRAYFRRHCEHPVPVSKIAMLYYEEGEDLVVNIGHEILDTFVDLNFQELLLVVGDFEDCLSPDTKFILPIQKPWEMLGRRSGLYRNGDPALETPLINWTWQDEESLWAELLTDHKAECMEHRQDNARDQGIPIEQLDNDEEYCPDTSAWKPPTVTYVEIDHSQCCRRLSQQPSGRRKLKQGL